MSQDTHKKTEQVALKLAPATFQRLGQVAAAEDRPLGYVARELMLRGLELYLADNRLRAATSPHSAEEAMHAAIKQAIPRDIGTVDGFDLDAAIADVRDPQVIMRKWFAFEGREYPDDFGVVFFQGWETFSESERRDALTDAKKVLDRSLKQIPPKNNVVAKISGGRKPDPRAEIQKMIEAVPVATPRKRKAK